MDKTLNNKMKNKSKQNESLNSNNFCLSNCCSKISITIQFIIFFIPILIIFISSMIIIHVYLVSEVLKFDFYAIVKEELLKYFLTDLDVYHLKIFQIWPFSEYISKSLVLMDY